MALDSKDIEIISNLLDSKLEPIINSLESIKTDVSALQKHVESINTRLGKLERRTADLEVKVSEIHLRTCILEKV